MNWQAGDGRRVRVFVFFFNFLFVIENGKTPLGNTTSPFDEKYFATFYLKKSADTTWFKAVDHWGS